MGLFDGIEHAAEAVGHEAAKAGRAVTNAVGELSGMGSAMRSATHELHSEAADKRGEQQRSDLERRSAGLRGQTTGGFDQAAITSRTNWRSKGHGGIYDMLQHTVNPRGITESGTALSDLGKQVANGHDIFEQDLARAVGAGWQGDAKDAATQASSQVVRWGCDMGTALDLTGTQIQLAGAAAQQAKGSVQPPPPATGLGGTFLKAGKDLFTGNVGGAWDVMNASSTAKAHQEAAVRVMEAVYTPTFVEADSTTPAFAHPVDPTAPAPTDQPPPGQVSPPPGHVPSSGVPIGRGYQPPALRPSPPPPPSGFVPPPGLNPQPPQRQPLPDPPWQGAPPIRVQPPQSPIGTGLQGYDPGTPGGQPPGGQYGGGSYGGGQYGSQSGGGVGSVPFGPLGSSSGGSSGGGVGAGGRYGSGQSGVGPGGRAGVGGPGGSGEVGARGMGGAGARDAAGAGGMPMGGGAGRGGRGEEDGEHRSAGYLVNADNGNEIVGDLGKVAPPVIGEG